MLDLLAHSRGLWLTIALLLGPLRARPPAGLSACLLSCLRACLPVCLLASACRSGLTPEG
eukprot:15453486-Alexandrium_andersonii.AAC.1